ncbi:MAG: DUF2075 domain-containing protein [Pseudomonas sp.]|nr:DUF2075 domain-containing protein [Pseudomonas sp.]
MIKRVNIKSLLQANDSLDKEGFSGFLKHYGVEIKCGEIEDLRSLVNVLSDLGLGMRIFDKFYVGYKIPQIGKEFDLLRFGKGCIINIELKRTCTEEKIKKQLLRNRYYLSFIGRQVYTFTYVSESQELYFLRGDGHLMKVEACHLAELLMAQEVDDEENADSLFNPSDYLVSPFNSTKKFLDNKYFLTHQQEEVKDQIISSITSSKAAKFISIIGSAGTGKTLLTYDIAKELIGNGRRPLIIHCGQLNSGHAELIRNGWSISPIKSHAYHDFANYDLVVIDEAQRIYPNQLDSIIDKINLAKCCCIFSHDKLQTLAKWEEVRDVSAKIGSIKAVAQFKLSEKIRTNKEIAEFIKMLFNKKRNFPMQSSGNIEINYFGSVEDAKGYLDGLDESKWEVLRFTPSQYNNEHHEAYSGAVNKTSHQIIGQEFEGVAVTIDRFFYYNMDGELDYSARTYYDPPKMLFQNITRSRKKLNLVIIGNTELLDRCIAILR